MRYGAHAYQVHRFRDDLYKFLQTAEFDTKLEFERYWHGPEFDRLPRPRIELVPGAGALRLDRPRRPRARSSPRRPAPSRGLADAAPSGDRAGGR